jgi:hypothetical protein
LFHPAKRTLAPCCMIIAALSFTARSFTQSLQTAASTATNDLGIIQGVVVDPGGTPVEDATVYAASDNYPPIARPYFVTTKANGEFVLDRVMPGKNIVVHAYKDGDYYMDVIFAFHNPPKLEMPEVEVKPGKILPGVIVRLMPKAGKLHLNVRDADTKELIPTIGYRFCREDYPDLRYCLGGGGESERDQFMPIGVGISIKIEADDGHHKKWEYRDAKTHSRYFRAKSGETITIDVNLRKK